MFNYFVLVFQFLGDTYFNLSNVGYFKTKILAAPKPNIQYSSPPIAMFTTLPPNNEKALVGNSTYYPNSG